MDLSPATTAPIRLLKLREVCDRTSLSRATIYRWMGDGRFPQPIKLTETCVRWQEHQLEAWIRERAGQAH